MCPRSSAGSRLTSTSRDEGPEPTQPSSGSQARRRGLSVMYATACVAGIEWDSRGLGYGSGIWSPERRHQVERVKLFPIRLYLALQGMRDELRDDESGQAMVE